MEYFGGLRGGGAGPNTARVRTRSLPSHGPLDTSYTFSLRTLRETVSRAVGAWERIDYVRDVKAQPPSAHAARARTCVTSSRGSADPGRVTVGERGERARRLGHTE
jgi:hypothetical protein